MLASSSNEINRNTSGTISMVCKRFSEHYEINVELFRNEVTNWSDIKVTLMITN